MPKQTQRQETAKNRLPRIAAAVLVLLVCCVPVVMLLALCGVEVVSTRVVCGGESQRVFSLTDDPQAILGKSSFTLGAFDKVDLDSFDPGGDYSTIVIKRHAMSHPTNEVARLMHTSAVTNAVADLASQMRALAKKKTVRVRVICDGKSGLFKLSGTVEDALKAAKITLGALDTVNRPLTAALEDDMVIRVQRVAYREARTKKTIDFKIEEMPTDTLYLGEGKVLREGVPGVRTVYYLEQTVDGEAQGKMKIGSAVTKEPINEVLLVGTKTGLIPKGSVGVSGIADHPAISQLPATIDIPVDVAGKPVHYKKKLVGEATAYSGGGGTSTGHRVLPGRVAVDPREIPYGTKMYIVSTDGQYIYGYCEAQDTGGFIHTSDTMVDLYMTTESACEKFGRRNVEIYILE